MTESETDAPVGCEKPRLVGFIGSLIYDNGGVCQVGIIAEEDKALEISIKNAKNGLDRY